MRACIDHARSQMHGYSVRDQGRRTQPVLLRLCRRCSDPRTENLFAEMGPNEEEV